MFATYARRPSAPSVSAIGLRPTATEPTASRRSVSIETSRKCARSSAYRWRPSGVRARSVVNAFGWRSVLRSIDAIRAPVASENTATVPLSPPDA